MLINKYLKEFNEKGYCIINNALSNEYIKCVLSKLEELNIKLNQSKYKKKTFGLNIRPIINQDDIFLKLIDYNKTFPIAVKILNHYNIQLLQSHLILLFLHMLHFSAFTLLYISNFKSFLIIIILDVNSRLKVQSSTVT